MKGDVLDGELLGFNTSGDSSPDSHYWTVTATLLADVVPYLIEGKASLELSQLSVKRAKITCCQVQISHFPHRRSRQSIELLREWDALTTCTVASICCGLPYSQSIRSCLPSDDPPASLRESVCSVAFNHSLSGYVLGSLQRPTVDDLFAIEP